MTVSSVPDPQMAEARKPAAAETKSTDDAVVEISYDLSSNGHNSVTSGGNAGRWSLSAGLVCFLLINAALSCMLLVAFSELRGATEDKVYVSPYPDTFSLIDELEIEPFTVVKPCVYPLLDSEERVPHTHLCSNGSFSCPVGYDCVLEGSWHCASQIIKCGDTSECIASYSFMEQLGGFLLAPVHLNPGLWVSATFLQSAVLLISLVEILVFVVVCIMDRYHRRSRHNMCSCIPTPEFAGYAAGFERNVRWRPADVVACCLLVLAAIGLIGLTTSGGVLVLLGVSPSRSEAGTWSTAECFDAKGNAILNSLFVWQSVAAISVFVAALSTTIHITLFAAHFLEPVYQAIWTLRNAAATVFLFVLLSMIASLVILL